MSARILDGRALSRRLQAELAGRVSDFTRRAGRPPGLAVVLVGDDPASGVYVRNKERSARAVGMSSVVERLPATASREGVLEAVRRLADDPAIDGLLVQLPLPGHLDEREVLAAIPPAKDVDGFHPVNAGKLLLGEEDGIVPCTPRGILALVDEAGLDLAGRRAVVVGRSNIVGKPVALLLLRRHATVTLCHSRTRDLAAVCRQADLLVASVGRPGLVRGDFVREGAVVIDVGINRVTDPRLAEDLLAGQEKRLARFREKGRALVGDVHFGEAAARAAAITPVPGGVGPLTVTMLLDNTLLAAERALARGGATPR